MSASPNPPVSPTGVEPEAPRHTSASHLEVQSSKFNVQGSKFVLLVLVTVLAYLPVFHGGFVWDDFLLLKRNPLVTGELNLRTVWFQTDFPLSTVAFWLEWLAFGKQPAGYHIVNLALHALSVVLIWRLLARLNIRGAWLAAALFAVHPVCVSSVAWISELKNTLSLPFFLLSVLFYLRSEANQGLKSEIDNRGIREIHGTGSEPGEGSNAPRSHAPTLHQSTNPSIHPSAHPPIHRLSPSALFYPLSFVFFLLALLSKTSTVMLPVALLLCAWWRQSSLRRSDRLRTGPFFLLSLLFGLLTVWFQSHQAFTTATVQTEGFWARLAGAGLAVWFYIGKALLPLHLNAIYPRWQIDPTSLFIWLPTLGLVAVFFLCWRLSRTEDRKIQARKIGKGKGQENPVAGKVGKARIPCLNFPATELSCLSPAFIFLSAFPTRVSRWPRHLLFGLGCFVVTLFPALGFFDMYYLALSRVADHFQYLSLMAILALVAAVLTTFAGSTESDDTEHLTKPTLAPLPTHPSIHQSTNPPIHQLSPSSLLYPLLCACLLLPLGLLTFHRAQVWSSNETLWQDTLAKNPAAWTAHNNLGCILAEQRRYDQALTHFAAAVQFNPANADAHANLAQALSLQGRFPEAEPHFRTALQLKPDSADAHCQFASALARQGRLPEAVLQLHQAIRLQPTTPLRQQYAALLYQTGNPREAVAQLRLAVAAQPDSPELLNNLAWLLATSADATLRNGTEAAGFAERACQLTQSRQPVFLATLAAAYAEAGRFPEAVATAEQARDTARSTQQEGVARQTEALLNLYRAGTPYRERPAPNSK